jgi:hypothetical protein
MFILVQNMLVLSYMYIIIIMSEKKSERLTAI